VPILSDPSHRIMAEYFFVSHATPLDKKKGPKPLPWLRYLGSNVDICNHTVSGFVADFQAVLALE